MVLVNKKLSFGSPWRRLGKVHEMLADALAGIFTEWGEALNDAIRFRDGENPIDLLLVVAQVW